MKSFDKYHHKIQDEAIRRVAAYGDSELHSLAYSYIKDFSKLEVVDDFNQWLLVWEAYFVAKETIDD